MEAKSSNSKGQPRKEEDDLPQLEALGMNEPSPEKKPRSDGPDAAAIEKRVQYINKLSTFVSKVAETGLLKDVPCAKTWQRHCRDKFQTHMYIFINFWS